MEKEKSTVINASEILFIVNKILQSGTKVKSYWQLSHPGSVILQLDTASSGRDSVDFSILLAA